MQFHIPQYIDIEDKLFGPLTLKEAIYVAGGAWGIYFVYRIVPYTFIAVPIMVGIAVLTWALAFFPKEKLGKPFVEVLEAGFSYFLGSKLYTWKKTTKEQTLGKEEEFISAQTPTAPTVPTGKLSNVSFNLDTKSQTQPEKELQKSL